MRALALLAALLGQDGGGPVPLRVEPAHPRVGDHVVVRAELPAAAGERLNWAQPCSLDGSFARVTPELTEASPAGAASLNVEMVAGDSGRFRIGPFHVRIGEPPRELETTALDVEVTPGWPSDQGPGFQEWREPRPPGARLGRRALELALAAAALALSVFVGWLALRRRRGGPGPARARPRREPWRAALVRLAAAIPEEREARRGWFRELSDVARTELERRCGATRDRTGEELVAAAAPADDARRARLADWMARVEAAKFSRASGSLDEARTAAAGAVERLAEGET
jgi:hypothetical protein